MTNEIAKDVLKIVKRDCPAVRMPLDTFEESLLSRATNLAIQKTLTKVEAMIETQMREISNSIKGWETYQIIKITVGLVWLIRCPK